MPLKNSKPLTNNYELITTLVTRLSGERRLKSNNESFNNALDEAIDKLNKLKKYY